MQRRRALVGVVGIDDERLRQLARGAGELGEHEHAALVVARGDELLGDEVHAVVQAADEAHVGGAVVLVDLVRLVMLGSSRMIGGGAALGEARVDRVDERAHALLVVAGSRSMLDARRRGDLDERELPDPLRLQLEQALDRAEALDDALGVVEAVDADAERVVRRQVVTLRARRAALRRPACAIRPAAGGHSIEIG